MMSLNFLTLIIPSKVLLGRLFYILCSMSLIKIIVSSKIVRRITYTVQLQAMAVTIRSTSTTKLQKFIIF